MQGFLVNVRNNVPGVTADDRDRLSLSHESRAHREARRTAQRSEINAASVFFPIAVARRVERVAFRRGAFARIVSSRCRFGHRIRVRCINVVFVHSTRPKIECAIVAPNRAGPNRAAKVATSSHRVVRVPATPPVIAEVRCLVIAGDDARRFAQAQFASDLDALADGQWQWSAWLTPAGRVRALMQLFGTADRRLVAVLRGGDAEAIRAGLASYLLRAHATLNLETRVARAGPAEPLATVRMQDRGAILGCGDRSLWLTAAPAQIDRAARAAWHLADIRAGWPTLPAGEPRQLGPALGLTRLGAIALGKGCYPGQEIIARLHYRDGQTRTLHHIRGTPAPALGEHATGRGMRTLAVLDVEPAGNACEALVVAPQTTGDTLDIDGVDYSIVARFAS